MILHVVSVSGGKDSTAVACLALATQPRESLRFVFADTGNEHELTYEHLDYLEQALQIKIHRLRENFDREIANKRVYVLEKWADKGVPADAIERAAKHLVPTGNPYLDLCIWKGKFPSRRAQFCTEFLKTKPLTEYQMGLIDSGEAEAVWSWQGVRLDESHSRKTRLQGTGACVRAFDVVGGGMFNYRPILRWTAADAFEAAAIYDLEPNPLYLQGMGRVGCMPCVNANKDELLEISKRFPGHIDRIEYWEHMVGLTSKRMEASFFADPDRQAHLNKRGIRINEEPKACESAYGLCE